MRKYWLRVGIRAVIDGPFKTCGSILRSELTQRGCQTFLSKLSRCQPSARCIESNGSLLDVPDLLGSSLRALPAFPAKEIHKTGFRPWSSASPVYTTSRNLDCGKGPHVSQDGQSKFDADSKISGREIDVSRSEEKDHISQESNTDQRFESQEASPAFGADLGLELEVDCIEVGGDGPELAVTKTKKSKLVNVSQKGAEASLPSLTEDNSKLLLSLGANEEQMTLILKRYPEYSELPFSPSLMESVRLFEEFEMNSKVLLRVIERLNKVRRQNIFLHTAPHKPKQILTYLRDKIGVKNMGKVVKRSPTLLYFNLETLIERVKTLESLGVVVDGDLFESYTGLLHFNPIAIKGKAKALEMALGPRCHLKCPLLFYVKEEDVAKRVTNLQDILGEDLTKECLGKHPIILMSREATVKEMCLKLIEMFPNSELMTLIQMRPDILGRNWKNLHSKFEYLTSKEFSKDELLKSLPRIAGRSLETYIKPRVEQALRSCKTEEERPDLSIIFMVVMFVKRFGVT